jgi:hypothetical protein
MYTFKVFNRAEDEVWEVPYEGINLTEEINKGLDGTLKIPYPSIKKYATAMQTTPDGIFASSFRSWRLFRDGNLLFRGVFSHRRITGGQTGATSYEVKLADYFAMLARRYTALEVLYDGTDDSADIAWDLIDTTQLDDEGDLGITRGTHPTTKDRQRTLRHDNVRDVLVGMSRLKVADGYDMDINNQLQFNIYYPTKGTLRPEIVFNDFNIISWSSDRPLTAKLANRVHVLGAGTGAGLTAATRNDTTQRATWGLLTGTLSEKGVSDSGELNDRGDRFLEKNNVPTDTIAITCRDVSPDISTYDLGDTVTCELSEIDFKEEMRVEKRVFDIKPNGQAVINVGLGEALYDNLYDNMAQTKREVGDLQRY